MDFVAQEFANNVESTRKEVDTVCTCYNQYEEFSSKGGSPKPSKFFELLTKQNEELVEMEKDCDKNEMILNELWTRLESEMYKVIKK